MTDSADLCDQETMDRLANLMRHGDATHTLAALTEALVVHPHDARIYLLRGSLYASEADVVHARLDLREAALLDPFLEEARFMLGYLEYTEGHLPEAQAVWKPLLGVADNSPIRMLATAMLSLLNGDTTRGRDELESVLALTPSDAIRTFVDGMLGELRLRRTPPDDVATNLPLAPHFLISDYVSNQTKH